MTYIWDSIFSFVPQVKGLTNALTVLRLLNTNTTWLNTNDCTAAKSRSSAPSAWSASHILVPTASTWITATPTASLTENRPGRRFRVNGAFVATKPPNYESKDTKKCKKTPIIDYLLMMVFELKRRNRNIRRH